MDQVLALRDILHHLPEHDAEERDGDQPSRKLEPQRVARLEAAAKELQRRAEPFQHRTLHHPVPPCAEPLGIARDPARDEHDQRDGDDQRQQQSTGAAGHVLHAAVLVAGEVAEQREPRRPDRAAQRVVEQEARIRDLRDARHPGHQHAQRRGEPPEEHGLAAVAAKEPCCTLPMIRFYETPERPVQQTHPEVLPDLVPHGVADDRAGDGSRDRTAE